MEWIVGTVAGVAIIGAAVAVYERRTRKMILKHDFNLDTRGPSEADRAAERAAEAFVRPLGGAPDRNDTP